MAIFSPTIDGMANPVVAVCPKCQSLHTLSDLDDAQKQFLLDATLFHKLNAELTHLKALDQISRKYPGTTNRLVLSKTKKAGSGADDPEAVNRLIAETPGLHDYLVRSSFLFSARFPFVAGAVAKAIPQIETSLVACTVCDHYYLTLTRDYYWTCG